MSDRSGSMPLTPRESAKLICESSQHATIKPEGIEKLATSLIEQMKANRRYIDFKAWKTHLLNPKTADEKAIDWIFLIDALNFSFWTPEGSIKYMIKYGGSEHTGYWSLCAAINRALDEGVPVTSAQFCKDISIDKAREVFRSDSETEIPLLEERVQVMNEIGSVLLEKYNGKFSNCIKAAGSDAQTLLRLIVENFPCFRDEAMFNNRKVSFYKRAQILIADIWACFEGKGLGYFVDIDSITMFADYRIPQTLVYFDAIQYSEELNNLLQKEHMFSTGDLMEMEIRAASIWAVELLAERMRDMISSDQSMTDVHINAILLDHFLWDYRRLHDAETKHIPYHKIRCIYY